MAPPRWPLIRGARAAAGLASWAIALAGVDCRPAPAEGGACSVPDRIVCAGATRAFVCSAKRWRAIDCKGRRGCTAGGPPGECDDTIAQEGDRCPPDPPVDYACTPDGARALVCQGGSFRLWRHCRGSDHCAIVGAHYLQCDTTVGQAGDPCERTATYACSTDGRQMLLCDGTSLAIASSCLGPGRCRVDRDSHKVLCDDIVAREGDPCDHPKRITCGVDGKSELVCEANRYVKKRECLRTDCRIDHDDLFCD